MTNFSFRVYLVLFHPPETGGLLLLGCVRSCSEITSTAYTFTIITRYVYISLSFVVRALIKYYCVMKWVTSARISLHCIYEIYLLFVYCLSTPYFLYSDYTGWSTRYRHFEFISIQFYIYTRAFKARTHNRRKHCVDANEIRKFIYEGKGNNTPVTRNIEITFHFETDFFFGFVYFASFFHLIHCVPFSFWLSTLFVLAQSACIGKPKQVNCTNILSPFSNLCVTSYQFSG